MTTFMWRSLLPSYRRLMRDGAKADALVVTSKVTRGSTLASRLTLRVHFPDGTSTEVVRRVRDRDTRFTRTVVGDIMPMRYDRANHDRIAIDYPTVQRLATAERGQLEGQLRRSGERKLAETRRSEPSAPQPSAHDGRSGRHEHGEPAPAADVAPVAPPHEASLLRAAADDPPAADDAWVFERLREAKRQYRAGTLDRDGVAAEVRRVKDEQFQRELTAFLDSPE